ncbi:DUF1326 domain-containing protein [Ramlibacter sp. WS9]|uniref:DUF1326 domain-containing protein n=1 Tax=Ramlibacter sp. WS9 TaxID=1882741 RepID=UPI0011436649|nr:DUF1326 domain-containing protein [Ramlibacter sp. WS9]ROZ79807.1 DUF1326 domain-containing protein [Ramlibacter sp. WS9]
MSSWSIKGQYMETCNCTLLCPCIWSNMTARPTEGDCKAAVAMRIEQGQKDGVKLDGLSFVVMLHSPGAMGEGNITVGLIVDDAADDKQVDAIRSIATGEAGGPMAALAPLVGKVAGIEKRPIQFTQQGLNYSLKAGELVDQACEGLESAVTPGEAIGVDNVAHPVNTRLSLAKATRSKFHAFGIDWEDTSGTRNGHFAPFAWAA